MSNRRAHYATTTDGATLGGTVHGDGPPLVFLQGAIGDGDIDWQGLLPYLTDRFTCHLTSYRGRGLSGDHPDLSPSRLVDDVIAYVDSIGEPPGLVGWSGGAVLALGAAAAQPDAVNAVAPFEPGILSLADEEEQAIIGEAVARTAELAAEGDLRAAARAFARFPFSDEEVAAADDAGYFDAAGRYVPGLLSLLEQWKAEPPTAEDPATLGAITAPVLVLLGADTKPIFTTSAQYVADHVPNARVQEIRGAAHAAPLTHPEALAEALTEFFAPVRQPA